MRLPDSLTVDGPVSVSRPWIAWARAVTRLTTTGRASRSEFWWTWLLQTVIWTVWSLLTLAPMVALAVRRLHDADISGWWALGAVLVPLLSFVVLVLLAQRSKPAGARFDRWAADRPGADRPSGDRSGGGRSLAPPEGSR